MQGKRDAWIGSKEDLAPIRRLRLESRYECAKNVINHLYNRTVQAENCFLPVLVAVFPSPPFKPPIVKLFISSSSLTRRGIFIKSLGGSSWYDIASASKPGSNFLVLKRRDENLLDTWPHVYKALSKRFISTCIFTFKKSIQWGWVV